MLNNSNLTNPAFQGNPPNTLLELNQQYQLPSDFANIFGPVDSCNEPSSGSAAAASGFHQQQQHQQQQHQQQPPQQPQQQQQAPPVNSNFGGFPQLQGFGMPNQPSAALMEHLALSRVRELELSIASEKRKEREAELEIERIRERRKLEEQQQQKQQQQTQQFQHQQTLPHRTTAINATTGYHLYNPNSSMIPGPSTYAQQQGGEFSNSQSPTNSSNTQSATTMFDKENSPDLDDLFNFLPASMGGPPNYQTPLFLSDNALIYQEKSGSGSPADEYPLSNTFNAQGATKTSGMMADGSLDLPEHLSPHDFNLLSTLNGTPLAREMNAGVVIDGSTASTNGFHSLYNQNQTESFLKGLEGIIDANLAAGGIDLTEDSGNKRTTRTSALQPPAAKQKRKPSSGAASGSAPNASASTPVAPAAITTAVASSKKPKRTVIESTAACSRCSISMAKIFLRGEKSSFDVEWEGIFNCLDCRTEEEVKRDGLVSIGGGNWVEGAKSGKKRSRQDDTAEGASQKIVVCDVCNHAKGNGGIFAGEGEQVQFTAEVVCTDCSQKYQRCTDCGGGGGVRLGIGKWRCKELFGPSRKTCSLSHTRIGTSPIELGVFEVPNEIPDENIAQELVSKCESMWREKTLMRLAVPELLECPLDPTRPLRKYQDIEDVMRLGNPTVMDTIYPKEPLNDIRRFISLTWVKTRTRRGVPEPDEVTGTEIFGGELGMNITKTDEVLPNGCELIAFWMGDWNVKNGTLLITTSLPFEGSDGDDRAAMTIGEMACKVVMTADEHNKEVASTGIGELYARLEHLWVVSDGASPLTRERMNDVLCRRRNFLPLNEYLLRHPEIDKTIFAVGPTARPDVWCYEEKCKGSDGIPHKHPSPLNSDVPLYDRPGITIMARHLGKRFDRKKLEELGQTEIGRRIRAKRNGRIKKTLLANGQPSNE